MIKFIRFPLRFPRHRKTYRTAPPCHMSHHTVRLPDRAVIIALTLAAAAMVVMMLILWANGHQEPSQLELMVGK